jgi:hypothetical protein
MDKIPEIGTPLEITISKNWTNPQNRQTAASFLSGIAKTVF